jgi:hypothetical protein
MTDNLKQTRNQHYVPQFLIRNFSSGKRKQVWAFDKNTKTAFRTTPRNIGSERDFYDFDTPEGPASLDPAMDVIDDAAAPLINIICTKRLLSTLTEDERVTISVFAAVQMLRTRAKVDMWTDLNAQMAAALWSEGTEPNTVKGFEELSADESRTASWSTLPHVAREIAPHFLSKSWVLQETTLHAPFYLGDNPVVMHNTLNQDPYRGTSGLAVEGIEIYLPISSTLVMCFLCPSIERGIRSCIDYAKFLNPSQSTREFFDMFQTGTPLRLLHENVEFLNSLQVANASRSVYCRYDQFNLAQEMLRSNPELSTGPRIRMNWPSSDR